jgi:hypothetical protein
VREAFLLRRACRRLAPASLKLASGTQRYVTFLYDVTIGRDEAAILLSPIGARVSGDTTGWLDFAVDDEQYVVGGMVADAGNRQARFVTRQRPQRRAARSGRIPLAAGRMVAVFVPEGVGLGRCYQPVLDLNQRALRLRSSHPLEPGTVLRSLELILGNRIVRECEGVVLSRIEIVDALGRASFECRVRLRASSRVDPEDDPADLYEITEPRRVRAILWALSDLSHPVTVRSGSAAWRGQLEPVRGSRDGLPLLRCRIAGEMPALAGAVQIECALYGSGYRLFARVRGQVGHVLMLAPAPVLREWHRRDEERVVLGAGETATLGFVHPITRHRHRRPIEDISVNGVGLRGEREDDLLWPDLPLENVRLALPGLTVRPAVATVRTVSEQGCGTEGDRGPQRCGIEIDGLSERDADRLRVELTRLGAKPIEIHDGVSLDAILRFHASVRLLEPDMQENLAATLDDTRRQWRTAHEHPDGLMRTALVRWKDGIGATLTLVRAYESTWVLQHSAVASPAVPANPGMLHSLLVRLAIPRADGEYVCGYIDEEARSQHAVMNAFFAEWSTPEFRGATRLSLWSAPSARPSRNAGALRRLDGKDAELVARAAGRLFDPVCVGALGLERGQLALPHTRAAFRRVGLTRTREAWGSFAAGRCTAVLVREIASPGLCLSSLLSAGTLIPIDDRDGEGMVGLCRHFLAAPLPGDPPFRFMLLPEGSSEAALVASGFRRQAGCTLYAMHRFGLQEYHRYVASRYGFLHGRLRARTTEAA